jgi:hypothetical protein
MGWWSVGGGDDVIGDEVADALGAAMPATSPVEVLVAALEQALGAACGETIDCGGQGAVRLTTEPPTAPGTELLTPSADDVQRLRASLDRVGDLYRERWGRRPRLTEVIAAASFVLGPRGSGEQPLQVTVAGAGG